jgi:cysteine desulfurase
VQAVGKLPATLRECPADLLSFSAHKLGGPAGVGVLVNRRGVPVAALSPGHQEDGRRGGTPSTALAEALALALGHAFDAREATVARVGALRDRFEREVLAALPGTVVNGAGAPRVANTSNLRFTGVDGEALLIALDLRGICVSSGAACASGSLSPSHVLKAMGLDSAQAQASLRFSLGEGSTDDEVTRVVAALVEAVPAARDA